MEEIFKEFIYTFIKRNSDKIQYTYQELGFKNKNELLKSVKENLDDACWAFTELMRWGMDNNYRDLYQVGTFDDEYETQVFMIKDKLFTIGMNEVHIPIIPNTNPAVAKPLLFVSE